MKFPGIYKIQRIGTDQCYVGSSVNIHRRKNQHMRELNAGNHHAIRLQRAWSKYGHDAFEFIVLEECIHSIDLRSTLMTREQHWMDALMPCFNTCPAAESTLGFKMPRDIVERHRQQITGRKLSPEHAAIVRTLAIGLKRSDATKEKLRQAGKRRGIPAKAVENSVKARRGKSLTAEHIAKFVASNAGYKHTPETIEKMRASNTPEVRAMKGSAARGKTQSPEHVAKRIAASVAARKRNAEARNTVRSSGG